MALLPVLSGCGGQSGELAGRVTYKGEALEGGTVTVLGADGIPRPGAIQPDGGYRIEGIPVGEAKLLVVGLDSLPDPSSPQDAEAPNKKRADWKNNPASKPPTASRKRHPVDHKYAKPTTSPLKVTISRGQNSHTITVD